MARTPIVPTDFVAPTELRGDAFRLEPLGPEHNERDHAAWMGSIDHIRSLPGFDDDGDWPEPMSLDDNLGDLEMHARHFDERVGFTYTVLADDAVIGCVYVYPTTPEAERIEVRSWTTEATASVHPELLSALQSWMDESWPFPRVVVVGS